MKAATGPPLPRSPTPLAPGFRDDQLPHSQERTNRSARGRLNRLAWTMLAGIATLIVVVIRVGRERDNNRVHRAPFPPITA